jgi:hypothetical protein
MSKWVKVNMPWYDNREYDWPEYPIRFSEFCETYDNPRFQHLRNDIFPTERYDLDDLLQEELEWCEQPEEALERIHSKYGADSEIALYAEYEALQGEVADAWQDALDNNEEYQKQVQQQKVFEKEAKANSFWLHPMCRPGTLIEVRDTDGNKRQLLIGDMSENGGTTDDGPEVKDRDVVIRYKTVFEHKEK